MNETLEVGDCVKVHVEGTPVGIIGSFAENGNLVVLCPTYPKEFVGHPLTVKRCYVSRINPPPQEAPVA